MTAATVRIRDDANSEFACATVPVVATERVYGGKFVYVVRVPDGRELRYRDSEVEPDA